MLKHFTEKKLRRLCGGYAAVAQPAPPPIKPLIIRVTEIDRTNVATFFVPKTKCAAALGVAYKNLSDSNVCMIVSNGMALNQPVVIMDEEKVVATGKLLGVYACSRDPLESGNTIDEFGFVLDFESAEKANQVASVLRVAPDFDKVLRYYKKRMADMDNRNLIF